jgi:hypothetical protein
MGDMDLVIKLLVGVLIVAVAWMLLARARLRDPHRERAGSPGQRQSCRRDWCRTSARSAAMRA